MISRTFLAPCEDLQGSQLPIWKMGPDIQFSPALSCLVVFNLNCIPSLNGLQPNFMDVGVDCHFNCNVLRLPFESHVSRDDGAEVPIVAACACPASPAWQPSCRSWQHGCLPPPF